MIKAIIILLSVSTIVMFGISIAIPKVVTFKIKGLYDHIGDFKIDPAKTTTQNRKRNGIY